MKRVPVIFILVSMILFVSCLSSPSDEDIQTAIAQTASAPRQDAASSTDSDAPIREEAIETLLPTETPELIVHCPNNEVETYLEELDFLLEEWDDTVEIAGSTSRMSLSPVIKDLQDIKRDARRLERPECANYLQDLVVVAMESQINAFISFLAQDSDTVVARKILGAEDVRSTVDAEIIAFEEDALAAYLASNVTTDDLAQQLEQAEPFILPDGWKDSSFANNDSLIVSIPNDWTRETFGDNDEFTRFESKDGAVEVIAGVVNDAEITLLDSDGARLFALQTQLETSDYDFYSEHSAEVGVYALNKGYVVEFARRYSSGDDIEEQIWATVVTPEDNEVFFIISTTRDEFAQIDFLIIADIFSSIRQSE